MRFDDVFHNWEATLYCGPCMSKRIKSWIPPLEGVLKFDVDGVTRDNTRSVQYFGVGFFFFFFFLFCFVFCWGGGGL